MVMDGILKAVERYSGKKFFITIIGVLTIATLFQVVVTLLGPEAEPEHLVQVFNAACIGLGLVCMGGGISVGLSEMNKP